MKTQLALLAILARTAHASPCSDRDDDDDDRSFATTDDDDETPACVDTTDVHGYRRCTKFGAWAQPLSIPRVFVELGVVAQTFASPLAGERGGSVSHDGQAFAYRVTTPEAARAEAIVSSLRVGVASAVGLYGAGELELGALTAEPARAEMTTAGASLEERGAFALGALGAVGFARATGGVVLGAELAGGVRAVSYRYESRYLACEQMTSIVVARPVVEARARAGLFVTPRLTLGVQAASSLIEDGAWSAGVFLGGHTRAFGGLR